MASSFFLTTVAAAIGFFTLLRKLRFHHDNKEKKSTSLSPSSSPSSLSPSSVPPPSSSCIWTHQVFPSFSGEDVRRDFLSHIQMEFQRMGITPFVDNEIKRGESIGPELLRAIRGSKIAIILLSRNYASSKWCLDELVEIMKCREEYGQTVMAIFYKVDPSDVKKLTGDFGKVFRKTCAGKPKKDIGRWRQALEKVATVAGYHSINWDNEAAMIKKIATDISNILINSTPSRDFDGLVGMRAHLEKMKPLLCLDTDEVRIIGIWGPPGIGKTTIARVVYNQLSHSFQLSVFMENIKANYTRPTGSDDYSAKLQLQQMFMSQITKQKDIEIPHLGVAQDRLKDKKVLVVLDGVNQSVQLDAMAKEAWWFGPGSRIIITTQDQKLFRAHGINHIYKVDFPPTEEALQIFCMYAFGQNSPKDGFQNLAWKVINLAGNLPLGLRIMGSYFRGMSREEWKKSLPRLESSLDADIQSILKFSYDALDDEDKNLFLHIACFFNGKEIKILEEHLAKKFVEVRQRLNVLAEKSLISFSNWGTIEMHKLLAKLGGEIVRNQSIHEPGQRQFLFDGEEICDVLNGDAAGSKSVIGIDFHYIIEEEFDMNERVFEGMSNLQFLRFDCDHDTLQLSRGLSYLSRKLQLLDWIYFPMTCLPSTVNVEFLIELNLTHSKLDMLWEGVKPLHNLRQMDLSYSVNLKELPDLSTAINLRKLILSNCSSLIKLPSCIGNAINLEDLDLNGCSSLVELPSFGDAINLQKLLLRYCSNLVELPSSIGNAINLRELDLYYCSSLIRLPSSIGNAINLLILDLNGCSNLLELPSSIGNAINLQKLDLRRCAKLLELPSSIGNAINLQNLLLDDCSSLLELPSSIGNATNLVYMNLSNCSNLVELPLSIGNLQKLQELILKGCSKLEDLPININLESLDILVLNDCSMLKRFPEISTNVRALYLCGTAIEEVPLSIRSWPRLDELLMSYFDNLVEFPHVLDIITNLDLSGKEIQEVPPLIKRISRLQTLILKGYRKVVSLPQIPDSLKWIDAEDCESLERLDCSFHNPEITLFFGKCFKLNQEARDLIIQTPTKQAVLPGREVPAYFTHRASGGSLTIKLNERPLPTSMRYKACILLVRIGDYGAHDRDKWLHVAFGVRSTTLGHIIYSGLTEHLYTFEIEEKVTSSELVFEFKVENGNHWKIGECGLRQLS
ncbi:putative TIR domain, P-loop containing nucleoside triphosphate hydrolase [Arabidopsis thaliana]|uniref:ADP-ribosyl cyclase/cyclic ADP-ribose hydrolase n=1 Tax=Arabidopsis thaliana TaxID=3702 RepID=A0A178UIN0_ARATH|nr:hypothetical protein AXX17_AT5G10950 [Arabidopsis thaliana]